MEKVKKNKSQANPEQGDAESFPSTVDFLKEQGNDAVRSQKFEEAILHYTHAIKLDPANFTLYSNRSFAFLNLQQYFFALEDANETIKLNAEWPKGYFRKGETEYATQHYSDAYESYQKALSLKPDDMNLVEAIERSRRQIIQETKADEVVPWLGAGIGLIAGVVIVIADCIFTHKPTHPFLMAFVTITIAMVGFGVAKAYRYYLKCHREGLLQPPNDSITENGEKSSQNGIKKHQKFTKSQARQRYKKGKV